MSRSTSMIRRFRDLFWLPPRAHGDAVEDRSVSFLELFYDLVFVVAIARAAHHLSAHITWRGAGEFIAIFGLIWLAWLNGTTYHDLHGRPDGRSRAYVFLQMLVISILAVFTSEATGEDGAAFALTYTVLMLILSWLWYTVRLQDDEQYRGLTGIYLSGMLGSTALMAVSVFLSADGRLIVWLVFVAGWIIGALFIESGRDPETAPGVQPGDSLVERFGLFTIIVLGEVVVGVVTGLSEARPGPLTITTGILGLGIGIGIWWTYFDFVGSRRPSTERGQAARWMVGHFPVVLGIAASGAAMVTMIQDAGAARTSERTAWLLTGSVAVSLLALIVVMRTLRDFRRLPSIYSPVTKMTALGAGVALLIGWWRPTPWLLVSLVLGVLAAIWLVAVSRWIQLDDPESIRPNA